MQQKLDAHSVLNITDGCSESVASIYDLYLNSIIGEFRAVTGVTTTSGLSARKFTKAVRPIIKSTTAAMMSALLSDLSKIEDSLKDASVDMSALRIDAERALQKAYQSRLLLDAESVRSDVFRFSLTVGAKVRAGDPLISAVVSTTKNAQFIFVDRSGKRWNSRKHIFTVTRWEIIKAVYSAFSIEALASDSRLLLSSGEQILPDQISEYAHPHAKVIPVQTVK